MGEGDTLQVCNGAQRGVDSRASKQWRPGICHEVGTLPPRDCNAVGAGWPLPMKHARRSLVLFLWVLSALSAEAAALTGRVRDGNTNSFLPGATVVLRAPAREATTDRDGVFSLGQLPPGAYTVMVSYLGYAESSETVTIASEGDRSVEIALQADIVKLGRFIVGGEREGQARALQQKRTADSIMDVVSADSAGKLPDGNAAEAVRRLPGVFAEIDQNEGRYIVVRGIDSALNNTTINGVSVGSPESGTRGAAMDSVPADLISRIEVIKAVTPDMDAQGVGASVNIVTPSAFDRQDTFASVAVAGGYFNGPRGDFETKKTTPYSASGTYGQTFGDGKWGLIVGGSYSFRHYISNRQSSGGWRPAGPAGTAGANIYFPPFDSLFHYDVQRWRSGVNAALEYKPTADHYLALRFTDNNFKDIEGRELSDFAFNQTPFPASFTPTTATFTGGRATVEYRYYRQLHNITNYSLEGKHNLGDRATKLSYQFALGDASKQTPDRQDWEFRSGSNLTSTVDTSSFHWDLEPGAAYFNAASYPFRRVRFRRDEETEDNYNGRLDLKRERQLFGREGFVQIGARYFSRDKGWNRENSDFNAGTGANAFHLGQFGLSKPAYEVFEGYRQQAPQINLAAMQAFFKASPNYFVVNAAGNLSDSNVNDFAMQEDIFAGYAEAKVNFEHWSVLAGLRVEQTDADVTQTELPTAGSVALNPRLNRFSKRYTNLFPGVHLRATPTKQWVLRGSWTNTIGRPNYPDMAGASTFAYVENLPQGSNTYTGSVSRGNPGLKPYESMNFDLSSEYYFKHQGILSVGAFHKRIDNPVYSYSETQFETTYAGLRFTSLGYSRPENADYGKISGLEFNYAQELTMLPSPFDGLRFSVNYTLTDSEVKIFNFRPTDKLRFYKQPDKIYNVSLGYEKYRFKARVACTYTGDYATGFGGDASSDSFKAERLIYDAKVSYRISNHVTLFADVINLGQESNDNYIGPKRMTATEIYWWTANFGVTWKL